MIIIKLEWQIQKRRDLIIYSNYLLPNEEQNYRLQELIQRLKLLGYKYNNLTLILFGDLHMNREVIEKNYLKNLKI